MKAKITIEWEGRDIQPDYNLLFASLNTKTTTKIEYNLKWDKKE